MIALTFVNDIINKISDTNTYEEILKNGETEELQQKTATLAKKMGMNKIPHLVKDPKRSAFSWAAVGTYHYPNFRGIISIPSEVFQKGHPAYHLKGYHNFALAHELSHFFNRHAYWQSYSLRVLFMSCVPVSLCVGIIYSPIAMIGIEVIATAALFIFWFTISRLQEKQADLDACRYSNDEEKLSFIAYCKFALKANLQYRNEKDLPFWEKLKRRIKVDSQGNNLTDLDHPPLTERIRYIQSTLDKRISHIDPEAFLIKSMRNDKRLPFLSWFSAQVGITEKGKIRSISKARWKMCEQSLILPYYLFKYYLQDQCY